MAHTPLHQLGKKHGADKASHKYLDAYHLHLSRLKPVNKVLEIGVRRGPSLRMWAEYWPTAQIHGVDINPECAKHAKGRIKVFIGSQTDSEFLAALPGPYDFIIDDGSHVNLWTLSALSDLWDKLRPGGIYILEDMTCSYKDLHALGCVDNWPGMKYNKDVPHQHREDMDAFFQQQIHEVDRGGAVKAVHFYHGTAILEKADA